MNSNLSINGLRKWFNLKWKKIKNINLLNAQSEPDINNQAPTQRIPPNPSQALACDHLEVLEQPTAQQFVTQ